MLAGTNKQYNLELNLYDSGAIDRLVYNLDRSLQPFGSLLLTC
jgi:hypothetical protein